MRVSYEVTVEDQVEFEMQILMSSRMYRRKQWIGGGFGTLVGLVLSWLFFSWLSSLLGHPPLVPMIATAFVGVVMVYRLPETLRKSSRKGLRTFLVERLGSTDPYLVEIELSESGFHSSTPFGKVTIPWSIVEKIWTSKRGIELTAQAGGRGLVRRRAFESEEEESLFRERMRAYEEAASGA